MGTPKAHGNAAPCLCRSLSPTIGALGSLPSWIYLYEIFRMMHSTAMYILAMVLFTENNTIECFLMTRLEILTRKKLQHSSSKMFNNIGGIGSGTTFLFISWL
jgi:hypothetical protein